MGFALLMVFVVCLWLLLWTAVPVASASPRLRTTLRMLGTAGLGLLAERKEPLADFAVPPKREPQLLAVLGSAGGALLVSDEPAGSGTNVGGAIPA